MTNNHCENCTCGKDNKVFVKQSVYAEGKKQSVFTKNTQFMIVNRLYLQVLDSNGNDGCPLTRIGSSYGETAPISDDITSMFVEYLNPTCMAIKKANSGGICVQHGDYGFCMQPEGNTIALCAYRKEGEGLYPEQEEFLKKCGIEKR